MVDSTTSPARSKTPLAPPVATAALLWAVLVPVAATGLWALLFPTSFAASYPGLGLHWVAGDGPPNEHLTRDVGALSLALVGVTLAGPRRWTPALVAGWELYALPHLIYHLFHLHTLSGSLDRVTSVAGLVALAVLPLLGLAVEVRGGRRDRTAS
jgi:hypothetical protein